jgi:hypothetical protein
MPRASRRQRNAQIATPGIGGDVSMKIDGLRTRFRCEVHQLARGIALAQNQTAAAAAQLLVEICQGIE